MLFAQFEKPTQFNDRWKEIADRKLLRRKLIILDQEALISINDTIEQFWQPSSAKSQQLFRKYARKARCPVTEENHDHLLTVRSRETTNTVVGDIDKFLLAQESQSVYSKIEKHQPAIKESIEKLVERPIISKDPAH